MHNSNTYKFFCFSNIFPPTLAKRGQSSRLLFSSPNIDLITTVFSYVKDNLVGNEEVNIGEQQYHLNSCELIDTKVMTKQA